MRLKQFLLASVCAVALPALASAADLPLRSAPPAFVPPPVFTWTGFYIGVNAGYDFDHESRFRTTNNDLVSPPVGTFVPFSRGVSDDGIAAGGQIGYNYQIGGFGGGAGFAGLGAAAVVIGLEADAAYTDIDRSSALIQGNLTGQTRIHSSMDYLGTVRGRVGLAFDRVLVYGTGGFAYGGVSHDVNFFNPNLAPADTLQYHGHYGDMQTGYAVGGGIEYAVPTNSFLNSLNFFHSSAVTIKAEYLYYDLGNQNVGVNPVNGAAGTGYTTRVKTDGSLARIGLNYKF